MSKKLLNDISKANMSDETKIGKFKYTDRCKWAKSIEPLIKDLSPFPISYDVDSTQPSNFREYSYTHMLGGVYLNTQSIEINTRLMEEASKLNNPSNEHIDKLKTMFVDKYVLNKLNSPNVKDYPKHVGIMVGQNLFDLVSAEKIARLAFEDDNFFLKLHPITDQEESGWIANVVGWHKIITNDASGMELIMNCETASVTTGTELATVAVALEKNINNISDFFNETIGVYYPINRLYFKEELKTSRLELLNNILNCKWSGLIFPWMDDYEERIKLYFDKTLELRNKYGAITYPPRMKKIPIDKENKE